MWEFNISPATWRRCKIYEWDGVFTQMHKFLENSHYYLEIYKNNQLVWCWPTKLSIIDSICNSGIILKLDKPKKNNMMSVTNSHRLSWTTKNNTKFNKI
jgi:hypothetical protein